ncbi:hypothetical protein [Marinobacter sp. 2_MG-2023]|uniref:hypothetical protein n=1 Tax=Marinobacter sp. 2_MG-2023 TaxID=3062679 RepID=UPI0026E2E947|nr:hypothetical protein [Marinobacter sp. 2_MG-2023]MDO6441563.1 hypothetical protein [Marinobacter sp. 2_MG-2023]
MAGEAQLALEGNVETKECPKCAETVKAKATACRFCNHDFNQTNEASSPKVYLDKPLKVTSQKVYPASGKGTAVRIRDIQHVDAVVPPKSGLKRAATIALVLGFTSIALEGYIFGGFCVVMALIMFFQQFSMVDSFVRLSTASGPIIWKFDKKEHAPLVKTAVQEAISDSAEL